MKKSAFLAAVAGLVLGIPLCAQTDSFILDSRAGAGNQPRLVITTSTGAAHAEVRVENAILRISSTNPGTNVGPGDLRFNDSHLEFHDGTSWKTICSGPLVELGPAAAQTEGSGRPLIHLDYEGAGSPNLLRLQVGGTDKLVVTRDGQLRLLGGDLFTDRWTLDDTNTLLGVGVAGAGNLAATGTTAVGYQALYEISTGVENTAFGYRALYSNDTGNSNTAFGYEALYSNTSGSYSSAMGVRALHSNQGGSNNCAFGYQALSKNVSGDSNVAFGANALENIEGSRNVALGSGADQWNQSGSDNVAIGYRAGYGNGALHSKSRCVFIGDQAGYFETASDKLYIENSNSTTPLVYGDFASDFVRVHGRFEAVKASGAAALFDRLTDDGTVVSIRQDGTEEGAISVSGGTVSYSPFTGSHLGWTREAPERGMLVSMNGEIFSRSDRGPGEPVYGFAITSRTNDPAVLGAYLAILEPKESASLSNPHLVMSVGNGELWVVDTGRDIRPGDPLISSDEPGCAMVDPGTFETAHVVARSAESLRWSDFGEKSPRRAKISVLLERSVLRKSTRVRAAALEERLIEEDGIIDALEREIRVIESRKEDGR